MMTKTDVVCGVSVVVCVWYDGGGPGMCSWLSWWLSLWRVSGWFVDDGGRPDVVVCVW